MPAPQAGNAASGAVNLHRMLMSKYNDFSFASSTLNTAYRSPAQHRRGQSEHHFLRITFPALKRHMLTPRQIVDTMLAQHGVATGDDVSKLRDPLSQAMTSLSDLTKHMASFLLASQRLSRSGQGETAYRYFQLFLETVANFPSVAQSLTAYYAQYPAILNQSVAALFPSLEQMKDHLLRNDPDIPFSGAAHGNKQPNNQPKRKKGNKGNKTNQASQRTPPLESA
jgi:hypothetical protein